MSLYCLVYCTVPQMNHTVEMSLISDLAVQLEREMMALHLY